MRFYQYKVGQVDGLVQERRNSSVLDVELGLFCTDLSKWSG